MFWKQIFDCMVGSSLTGVIVSLWLDKEHQRSIAPQAKRPLQFVGEYPTSLQDLFRGASIDRPRSRDDHKFRGYAES